MNEASHVKDITVIDPDSLAPVEVSIYKDRQSGGIFGVDSSYILTLSDNDPVSNPFNGSDILLLEDQSSDHYFFADIYYADDRQSLGGLIFCSFDGLPEYSPFQEEDIFFFGMSFVEAKLAIGKTSPCNDYVITDVQPY